MRKYFDFILKKKVYEIRSTQTGFCLTNNKNMYSINNEHTSNFDLLCLGQNKISFGQEAEKKKQRLIKHCIKFTFVLYNKTKNKS